MKRWMVWLSDRGGVRECIGSIGVFGRAFCPGVLLILLMIVHWERHSDSARYKIPMRWTGSPIAPRQGRSEDRDTATSQAKGCTSSTSYGNNRRIQAHDAQSRRLGIMYLICCRRYFEQQLDDPTRPARRRHEATAPPRMTDTIHPSSLTARATALNARSSGDHTVPGDQLSLITLRPANSSLPTLSIKSQAMEVR